MEVGYVGMWPSPSGQQHFFQKVGDAAEFVRGMMFPGCPGPPQSRSQTLSLAELSHPQHGQAANHRDRSLLDSVWSGGVPPRGVSVCVSPPSAAAHWLVEMLSPFPSLLCCRQMSRPLFVVLSLCGGAGRNLLLSRDCGRVF